MKKFVYCLLILSFACQAYSSDAKDNVQKNKPIDPEAAIRARWEAPMKNSGDPEEMLKIKWEAVAKVLREKTISLEKKGKIIEAIVNPIFDFPLMSYLVLGKANKPKFNDDEYEKFSKLFVRHLKNSYREKISLYKDEKYNFKKPEKKKSSLLIPMEVVSDDKKITVVHKLRKIGKVWKIYDMEIQGVSVVSTYRSQFNDILARGTVDELLAHLKKPPVPSKEL